MPPDDAPFSCPCGDPLLDSLRPLLEPSFRLAREGQLPHATATALASGELAQRLLPRAFRDVHHAATLSRTLFQRSVAWVLLSEQWLDALASLLKACGRTRVLEVAAGAGVLAAPMRRRGLLWRTTDRKPAHVAAIGGPPEACDALAALTRYGDEVDAVFWSWWPAADEGDAAVAHECAQRGLAALFVGEPKGGCTGSDALWERFPVQPLSGQPGWQDVVNWAGMHDRTWALDMSLLRRVDQDHEPN